MNGIVPGTFLRQTLAQLETRWIFTRKHVMTSIFCNHFDAESIYLPSEWPLSLPIRYSHFLLASALALHGQYEACLCNWASGTADKNYMLTGYK